MPVPGSEHKSILSQRWPLSIDQICRPPPVGCSLQPPLQSSTMGLPDSPRQTWISQHRWRRALQNSRHKWMSSSPECLKCSQSASFSQVCPVYTMIPVNWGFDNIKTKEILPLPFMPLCLHFLTLPQLSLVEHTSFFFPFFPPQTCTWITRQTEPAHRSLPVHAGVIYLLCFSPLDMGFRKPVWVAWITWAHVHRFLPPPGQFSVVAWVIWGQNRSLVQWSLRPFQWLL